MPISSARTATQPTASGRCSARRRRAPLFALLLLLEEHTFKADEVERLAVRVSHQGANTTNNRAMPDICMQHLCAVMVLDGTVTFEAAHDDKRMRDRRVLALRDKVQL